MYERLLACGYPAELAREIIAQTDPAELERCVRMIELLLDFLTQSKLQDLQSENQGLKLAASQAAQNSYLVSQLRPSPIPAYTVQNPYCCNQFAGCGC